MSASLLGLAWAAKVGDSKTRKLVLMKLVDCCDDEGSNIWPALSTVAEHVGCSTQQVRRELRRFCEVGLLRKVRDGGRGTGSTAAYEMDIDMLARLRRPDYWKVLEAAALHDPLPKGDDDDDEAHAQDAGESEEEGVGHAQILGDMVSPLHGVTLTFEGSRVTSGVTQPLNRTLTEREGVRAHEDALASEGEPAAAPAALPTFEDFLSAYPNALGDNRMQLRAAWKALPFDQRRPAIDGIGAYCAERKAAGFKGRLSGPAYLGGRCWVGLEAKASQRKAAEAAGGLVEAKAWSREWWMILHARIAAKQRVGFMLQQAESGKSITVAGSEMTAAAKRFGELKSFVCTGPEIDAWRPWLAERGARIPVFDPAATFRVFLPGEAPPGGRADPGDADVPL
ncbi:helix-turn-helix domain-containing protein [Bosea sp. (in: a-proteobacteria)]|uniref:helix-turn-helix domain-containing protein n=1 Tax=Bosea sp. (in: a-proteobacteria) TaxID=1871050 RepID=UPI003B3B45E0